MPSSNFSPHPPSPTFFSRPSFRRLKHAATSFPGKRRDNGEQGWLRKRRFKKNKESLSTRRDDAKQFHYSQKTYIQAFTKSKWLDHYATSACDKHSPVTFTHILHPPWS